MKAKDIIKGQDFKISKRKHMCFQNPKGDLHLIWSEDEIFAITSKESDAELICLIPEFIQCVEMLNDTLKSITGNKGMIYEKINELFLKVGNICSKEAKNINVNDAA